MARCRPVCLLFLDIDGVLNFEADPNATKIHPSRVAELNRIVHATDADVILSSTWRKHAPLYEVEEKLRAAGFAYRLAGVTPSLYGKRHEGERGDEIKLFLDTFPGRGFLRPIAAFAVLDDCDDMRGVEHRLVQINERVGLTREKANQAIRVLAQPIEDGEIETGHYSPEAR